MQCRDGYMHGYTLKLLKYHNNLLVRFPEGDEGQQLVMKQVPALLKMGSEQVIIKNLFRLRSRFFG